MNSGLTSRRWLRYLVGGCVTMLVLSACSGGGGSPQSASGSGTSATPQRGGVLDAATAAEVRSFDPVDLSLYFSSGIDRAITIYGSLMKYDEQGEPVPAMAKSFTSEDGKVWTLRLREGVMFTDGTAYDAAAVKFNLKRHMAPDSLSLAKPLLADVTKVEIADPLTLRITLSEPNGSFPALFTQGSPLGLIGSPKAIKADPEGFGTHPVGAGPFVMEEYVRDDHLTVVRNEDYWNPDRPYLDKIVFNVITDNQTQMQSLKSGQLDLTGTLDAQAWLQMKDNPQYTIYSEGPPGAVLFAPNSSRGPGADLHVRKAIQMAFNPQASGQVLNPGVTGWDGDTSCLPFQADSPYCTGNAPEYDLGQAKQIISEYKTQGNSVEMLVLTSTSMSTQGAYVQQVLESIGLDVTLKAASRAEYSPAAAKGNYDGVVTVILPFPNPYPKVFNYFTQAGTNYPKQHDPKLEAVLKEARTAPSREARATAWKAVLERMNEKAYVDFLAPAPLYLASTSKVHLGNAWAAGGSIWYPTDAWIEG